MIDKTYFKNKKILVTGGTGMIGRQLVSKLCDLESEVTSVSMDNLILDDRAKYIKSDLTNIDNCKSVTKNKDIVFHVVY